MPLLTNEIFPQEIKDIILGYYLAAREVALGTGMHGTDNSALSNETRYSIPNISLLFQRNHLRATLKIGIRPEQPIGIPNHTLGHPKIPVLFQSVKRKKSITFNSKSDLDNALTLDLHIEDEFFTPYEFQTMDFGDLIWDHAACDVVENFYTAACLFSQLRDTFEAHSLSQEKLRCQITYNLSSKYAAESFGDVRVKQVWNDHPMKVDIVIGDPLNHSSLLEDAATAVKQIYDQETAKSIDEMINRGYIPDVPRCSGNGLYYNARDCWYSAIVLPGRQMIFDSWLHDIRQYHEMLLRVVDHVWCCPVSEKVSRRESISLSGLERMNLRPDDLQGFIRGVGCLMDRVGSGSYAVAEVC